MEKLLDTVAQLDSLAIVGMAKNAGKTECLNFILRKLYNRGLAPAVTSIGLDGESCDAVSRTPKPEITLYPGMRVVTAESFYRARRLTSEITSLGSETTSLGKFVEAKVVTPGKIIVAGPSDTSSIKKLIAKLAVEGATPVLIDGALSRLSSGSPAVTDAMILATGAVLSPLIPEIVRKTAFICRLIGLPLANDKDRLLLRDVKSGVWAITSSGLIDLRIETALNIRKHKERLISIFEEKDVKIFVAGAVTEKVMEFFNSLPQAKGITLIVRDFSTVFVTPFTFNSFTAKGNRMCVLIKPRLLGICVNPVSPNGFRVDSGKLCEQLTQATGYNAFDLMAFNEN